MTGTDEPFRSQQQAGNWGLQASMFAASQRAEVGDMAQRFGQQVGAQAQQAGQFAQEMQLREMEASGRMQEWQTERQLAMEKLRHLQAIDVTEQARLQTEALREQNHSMQLGNQAMEFDLKQKQKMAEYSDPQEEALARHHAVFERMAPSMLAAKNILDPQTKKWRPAADDKEWEEAVGRYSTVQEAGRRPLADQSARRMGAETHSIEAEAKMLREEMAGLEEGNAEHDGRRTEIKQRLGELTNEMTSVRRGGKGGQQQQQQPAAFGPSIEKSHPQLREHMEKALTRAGVKDVAGAKTRFWAMVENAARHLQASGSQPGDAIEQALLATLSDLQNGLKETMTYLRGQ